MLHKIILVLLVTISFFPPALAEPVALSGFQVQDTLKEKQLIFNGKVWIDEYSRVDGDQFLFGSEFLKGSVSMNKLKFSNILLRYDIFEDELTAINEKGLILQLNKEMVDSFSLIVKDAKLNFIKADSLRGISGFVNVLYPGRTSLFIKYKKNIELLAVDQKIDRFYQVQKNFLVKDGIAQSFAGKLEFFRLMDDRKREIKQFIKKNKISLSRKKPESFIPVLYYYDSPTQ